MKTERFRRTALSLFSLVGLFTFLLQPLRAQSKLAGLGEFLIGRTTPDSLRSSGFREQELVVVKGTLALPCAGIRVFLADSLAIQGIPVTRLFLVFYENRLFRITCDFGEPLRKAFVKQHGQRKTVRNQRLSRCDSGNALTLTYEKWEQDAIQALAVSAAGPDEHCQPEQVSRLTIVHQKTAAITSECDLDFMDPYVDQSGRTR
ncbi:hypothetical protein GCM10027299_11300 [Larkinella ripae]